MNRLIRIRLFLALAIITGCSALGIASVRPTPQSAPDNTVVLTAIPVLPTIVVTARAETPVLPAIVVRPSVEERQAALALTTPRHVNTASGGVDAVGDLLPHARLDMPYYSFGKMLPRASKD